ncbi:molybdenum cofactor guanylyltransferase [Halosimplex sp. J119]
MTGSRPERVRGVVLAGGRSTRFGEANKALATLDGKPVIAHVVEAVAEGTDGTPLLSVATESQAERLRGALDRPVEKVRDGTGRSGPLAGLAAAAGAAETPWLFVCACDMPLVAVEGIDALRARAAVDESVNRDAGSERVDAVVPVVDGYDQPLHALYRRSSLGPAVDSLSEDGALMALLDRLHTERVTVVDEDAPLAAAATNVNTRADLHDLRDD